MRADGKKNTEHNVGLQKLCKPRLLDYRIALEIPGKILQIVSASLLVLFFWKCHVKGQA